MSASSDRNFAGGEQASTNDVAGGHSAALNNLGSGFLTNVDNPQSSNGFDNYNNRKRKGSLGGIDHDSQSEDEDDDVDGSASGEPNGNRKRSAGSNKRVLKNAREKERSSRIAKQIDQLRDILTSLGVVVSKTTKSSVLSEVANYIRLLQQQQYQSEIDRNMLIQQIQMIGSGAHGSDAAAAIRQAAAQNGVWSLGNFEATAPKSSITQGYGTTDPSAAEIDASSLTKVDLADYRCIFNSSGVGMAIASMGGAFMDCNSLFTRLSNYSKQELCSLTIFNLTARNDLQRSFDLISRMISPALDDGEEPPRQIVLRGSMKYRNDLGMSISLVKGENGIAKCFVVTLVRNPTSPFDGSRPTPVSIESILPEPVALKEAPSFVNNPSPAFTSG